MSAQDGQQSRLLLAAKENGKMVVSNILFFHVSEESSQLTNIFQRG